MSYLSISFTHKNTDIEMREKLAFSDEMSKEQFLRKLYDANSINEVILLSTCNRVEIIAAVSNINESQNFIISALSNYANLKFDELFERADIYDNAGAIHHLFSVSSALDSLVIGETQIVGQLKDAYRLSLAKGYCDQKLTRAMNYAFSCAAAVRNATALGTGSVSVASTAVAKAKSLFKNQGTIKALVVGAGEMSELTIRHLLKSGFEVVMVSRNIKKAKLLAQSFDREIDVQPYENINKLLNEIPVMVTATSAPYPIITQNMTEVCTFNRYWFDIAVPRDIDSISSPRLKIYAVDDLQEIVNENMKQRAAKAKEAYSIVNKHSLEFFSWLKSLEVEPVVKHMYTRANKVITSKVTHAIKKGFIDSKDEKNIIKLCETILNEFLHQPTKELKSLSKDIECDMVLSTVQTIFGLKSDASDVHDCQHTIKFNNRITN